MDETQTYTIADAHQYFAKSLNGYVWELLQATERSQAQDELMVHMAHASCYHWQHAGTPLQQQRAEWLVAHTYTVLGVAECALRHAERCLELTREFPDLMEDFDWAYAYEGVARANALSNRPERALEFIERAAEAGSAIADDEDSEIFLDDFNGGNWYGLR